jgi:hypothetical protein
MMCKTNQTPTNMNINQDKITQYLTLINQSELEIERTGWVSEETSDAIEAIELTLTPDEINYMCDEMDEMMGEQ